MLGSGALAIPLRPPFTSVSSVLKIRREICIELPLAHARGHGATRRCSSVVQSRGVRRPAEYLVADTRALRICGALEPSLTLHPIGFLRTTQQVKFQAGHQPVAAAAERNELELLPGHHYEQALQDLAGFERVWLLSWFHRNTNWRPLVLPPRGPSRRRGVFATRSPHRPNALGLTAVPLLGVEGHRLILGPCDLVDGTPIFDVKPYIPAFDAFPGSRAGWIDELDAELQTPPRFTVVHEEIALGRAQWLRETWHIDFTPRMNELLARDPAPHRTRRIRRVNAIEFEIACGAWRGIFTVSGETVTVRALDSAFPMRFLQREGYEAVPDREAQLDFLARWPRPNMTKGAQ